MDKFQAIQTFVEVANKGGFASAARAMMVSPPSVTRIVSALEDHLGTALFVRTTRSVGLTEAGMRFLDDARRILAGLAEAEDAVSGSQTAPRGELRVTAPVLFGGMFVTPILGDFLDLHEHVTARAVFIDRNVNMIDEGIDVAVRIGELPDSSLMATRVGAVRLTIFAAPAYLERYGAPQRPADLLDHSIIAPLPLGISDNWYFQENGKPFSVSPEPRLRINTNDAIRDQVARGWGISRLRSYQIAPMLAAGSVAPILEEFEPPPEPIHVIHQEGRLASAKVRTFVDFVVNAIRTDPSIDD